MPTKSSLIYVHDPMCSWCWGFKPILDKVLCNLPTELNVEFLLGGLAVDSDLTMADSMKTQILSTWKQIQLNIPGTLFNFDFWDKCTPRRSTYPSCRAVIAAKRQDVKKEIEMITAIQHAYYLKSKNPSDYSILIYLANKINLDVGLFKQDIVSDDTNTELLRQVKLCRSFGANSFPSLYIKNNNVYSPIVLDYNNADLILDHINSIIG